MISLSVSVLAGQLCYVLLSCFLLITEMNYYIPTGIPSQPVSDKPGIYGAYNGVIPGTLGTRPAMQLVQPAAIAPGMQTTINPAIQAGLPPGLPPGLSPARPPSSPGMPQPPPQQAPGAPQPPLGLVGAAQLPSASTAGYATAIQPSPYQVGSAAGLYQGASLTYPQHSVSPVGAPPQPQVPVPLSGTSYMGRSVALYAGSSRMPTPLPASTYPGTAASGYSVSSVPLIYPAGAPAFSAPAPTYSVGSAHTPFPAESIPAIPSHIQQPLGTTAIPTYAAHPSGPPSFPTGVQPAPQVPTGVTPSVGVPLMAGPPYPPAGAAPFQRGMP